MSIDEKCPACGQGKWRAGNPVVAGFVTGCLCAPLTKVTAECESLRAQLAESVAREVQLREALQLTSERLCIRDKDYGPGGHVYDSAVAALRASNAAAPPSTAAAELVALRELEKVAHRLDDNLRMGGHVRAKNEKDLRDALAKIAAARGEK